MYSNPNHSCNWERWLYMKIATVRQIFCYYPISNLKRIICNRSRFKQRLPNFFKTSLPCECDLTIRMALEYHWELRNGCECVGILSSIACEIVARACKGVGWDGRWDSLLVLRGMGQRLKEEVHLSSTTWGIGDHLLSGCYELQPSSDDESRARFISWCEWCSGGSGDVEPPP